MVEDRDRPDDHAVPEQELPPAVMGPGVSQGSTGRLLPQPPLLPVIYETWVHDVNIGYCFYGPPIRQGIHRVEEIHSDDGKIVRLAKSIWSAA